MSDRSVANFLSAFSPAVAAGPAAGVVYAALTAVAMVIGAMPAVGQQVCRPALAIKDIHFSKMKPPTLERRWTATVSVDASRCAMNTGGYFEIGFSRLKENAVELEFREQFVWLPPEVKVSVDFWADEAVEAYWLDNVGPCPCRD
jgi:hypothetical protein